MITRQILSDFFSLFKMGSVSRATIVGLIILASSCSRPTPKPELDLNTVEKELRAFETLHRNAIDSKDIDGILQCYSPDYINVSADGPILYGRDFIRTNMSELYKTFDFHEDFKFVDIRIIGDRVAATYTASSQMTPLAGGETVKETAKGLCILKLSETKTWQFEMNAYSYDKK
jgi:ketosteroid isomerase-like protein